VPVVIVLAVVAVIVILAVDAVSQIGKASVPLRRTDNRSFAVLTIPIVATSNQNGAVLRSLMADGPSLGRVTLFSELDSLAADSAQDDRSFAAITPPDPTGGVVTLCRSAMQGRQVATARLQGALEALLGGRNGLGGGNEAAAASGVVGVGVTLRAADAAWANCRRALLKQPGAARLAESTWIRDPSGWTSAAVSQLVTALLSSPSLAPVHRLSLLSVATTPTVIPGQNGVSVVAPTSSFSVQVVVADVGNVDEPKVSLVVSAAVDGPGRAPPAVKAETDLVAGQSVVLSPPPLAVRPGLSYDLTVTATPAVGGGRATTSLSVQVSAEPPTTTTTTTSTTTTTVPHRH
jgi:hypothetical protein